MIGGNSNATYQESVKKILQDWRVSIPVEMEKELLEEYGNLATDDEGYAFEYTEQDISEQLRKRLRSYQGV
jgi:hypothetical protein